MPYVTKKLDECNNFWEVYQMKKYGNVWVEKSIASANEKEDTRMPDHFELEILQKGEE